MCVTSGLSRVAYESMAWQNQPKSMISYNFRQKCTQIDQIQIHKQKYIKIYQNRPHATKIVCAHALITICIIIICIIISVCVLLVCLCLSWLLSSSSLVVVVVVVVVVIVNIIIISSSSRVTGLAGSAELFRSWPNAVWTRPATLLSHAKLYHHIIEYTKIY